MMLFVAGCVCGAGVAVLILWLLKKCFHEEEELPELRGQITTLQRELVDANIRASNAFADGERQGCQLGDCPVCAECPLCPECPPQQPPCTIAFEDAAVTGCSLIQSRVQQLYDEKKEAEELAVQYIGVANEIGFAMTGAYCIVSEADQSKKLGVFTNDGYSWRGLWNGKPAHLQFWTLVTNDPYWLLTIQGTEEIVGTLFTGGDKTAARRYVAGD